MASEAQKAAQKRYAAKSTKQFLMQLNIKTDADIIGWLDRQENKQGRIKRLIREEIERGN